MSFSNHDGLASVFKVLGHPLRLRIILLLEEKGETAVGEISAVLCAEQSLVSHHLNTLKTVQLVKSMREGKMIKYSLGSEVSMNVVKMINQIPAAEKASK